MNAARFAWFAALAALAVWLIKALVIWEAGGLGKSAAEGPLFLLGFALLLLAFAAMGIALTAGRPTAVRIVAAILALPVAAAIGMLSDAASGAIIDEQLWVSDEAGLWFGAAVGVVLAWLVRRRTAPQVAAD